MSTEHLPVENQVPSQDGQRQVEAEKPADVEPSSQEGVTTPETGSSAPTPSAAAPEAAPEPATPPAADAAAAEQPAAEAPAPTPAEPAADAASSDETGGADPAPEAQATDAADDEGARRKVRLNPTIDPQVARPVPSIAESAESGASAETQQPTPATSEQVEAEIDAQAEEIVAAGSDAPESPPAAPAQEQVAIPKADEAAIDEEMESEIAAAMASGELEAANAVAPAEPATAEGAEGETAESATPTNAEELTEGTKLTGEVQSIHEDNVFLEFGLRMSGVVSLRQFGSKNPPQVGQKVKVIVNRVDDEEGLIFTNLPRGTSRVAGDWSALSPGQSVDCTVTKTNKGGLEVSVGGLRGFMPASQVDLGYIADLEPFVGQKLQARVIEVAPERRRLVLSRRALLQEERAVAEQELLQTLEAGETRTGRVKTIKDYGAFVDLGGVDGFLHIGQISWNRINHPSEVIQEGQQVEVKVLSIDSENKKISLSMRQLEANPWTLAEDKYPKGSVVSGKVTRTEAFGAFVELEPGVEGLVHISELDHRRVKRVTEVLNVGQTAQVQVLEVDPGRKRISLSVKALLEKPAQPTDEDLAPGAGAPYERKRKGPLKGGVGGSGKGGLFGNPSDFG
ncbi:MAG: S1 RNA-binding domain-containing protein [Maioricimonas sp. JB045]